MFGLRGPSPCPRGGNRQKTIQDEKLVPGNGSIPRTMQNDASCSSMRRRALCWCMKRPVYRCLVSCGNARLRALCCCRKLSMQSTGMPTPTLDLPICQWLHAPSHQAAASFPLPRPVGAEEEEAMHEAKFVGPPGIPGFQGVRRCRRRRRRHAQGAASGIEWWTRPLDPMRKMLSAVGFPRPL